MRNRFDAFVLFAEMRTGSNHLEESLRALPGVQSFGEIFNPAFLGQHNRTELFGIDMAAREADPMPLLQTTIAQEGLSGFRFFHDHDPRVLDAILDDPRIGKAVLTRNPLDSYVSLAIAAQTGQWRLTNPKMAKAATVIFDPVAFDRLVARQAEFRARIQRHLQRTGQTAFWIGYEDIADLEVINGLATWLGCDGRLDGIPGKLKRQNPGGVEEKVDNPETMRAHLAGLDPFLLGRSAHAEPPRGPSVPTLMAAAESPLLALPLPGGPEGALRDWLTALDGKAPVEGMTQKDLRPWMRDRSGFISFAVVRHPLARAFDAWRAVIMAKGPPANTLRRILTNQHAIDIDGDAAAGFAGFLRFLKANLGGQSSLPVEPGWASQSALLAGLAQAVLPQRIVREAEAQADLDRLAISAGRSPVPFALPGRERLAAILTGEMEEACVAAYRRDYLAFGFGPWMPP